MNNAIQGKILIVDDNPDNLKVLSEQLAELSNDIRVARDGVAAWDSIQADTPDLILLDILMPRMDGYELCQKLQQDEQYSEIPIIFLSALNEPFNKIKGFQLGAVDYIVKPFEMEEVQARVRSHLDGHLYQKELRALQSELENRVEESTKALRQSDELFRGYLESSNESFWGFEFNPPLDTTLSVDEQLDYFYSNAQVVVANAAWARQAGYESWEDMIGLRLDEIVPRSVPENEALLRLMIESGHKLRDFISYDRHKDGRIQTVLNNSNVETRDGKVFRMWGTHRDITEQEAVRNQLKEAEQKYRTVANFTYDWEYWEDPDGRMIYVSPSFERITGYTVQKVLDDPFVINSMILREDREKWENHIRLHAEKKTSEPIQFRIKRKDGTNRWIEHLCQPVSDEGGKYLGIRASNRDITDRKKAEAELRKKSELFDGYLRSSTEAIWGFEFHPPMPMDLTIDEQVDYVYQNARVTVANRAWAEYSMYDSPDDIIGLGLEALMPRALGENERAIRELAQDEFVSDGFITREYSKDGELLVVENTHNREIYEGHLIRTWGTARNVTEQEANRENLKRSEKQLRLIADSLPVFISYVDSDKRYRFTNQAYLDFFNLSTDQIIGQSVKETLGKDLYRIVKPNIDKVLGGEQATFEAKITQNGINYQIDTVYIPDTDDTGRTNGYFVLGTDVTKRRQKERELQKHRDELAHVSRLTTMGELTASMAHELNQPLTAILSNAQAARRFLEHDTVDIEEVKEILDDIIGDDRRAGQVIKRLRGFLKRGEFYLKSWDINEVIQEVVTLVHSDAVIRNVSVHPDLQEGLPHALGDRIQIQQVLLNLIINGLDAMIDVHPESRNLIIKTDYYSENSITVSVSDSGTGIQPDQMRQIFEPFHTTKTDGMGMGLSINRSIIQAHSGELWAQNNVNQGATFYFTLPIASGDNTDGE